MEQVKHLFSVKGITFILVTNRIQLEEMIKQKYGAGVDAANYLHKFINIWLALPKDNSGHNDDGVNFLQFALKNMFNEGEQASNSDVIDVFKEIIKYYQPSLREIERMLSYYSIIHNMSGNNKYNIHYQLMIAFVCFMASYYSDILKNLDTLTVDDFIESVNLHELDESSKFYTLFLMKKFVIFDLSDDDVKNKMKTEKDVISGDFGRVPNNVIKTVTSWIYEIMPER